MVLWEATKNFTKNFPQHVAADNSMKFLSDDGGETLGAVQDAGVVRCGTVR